MNYYPFHIGDFRSGTVNMSRQSRWIYRDMLDVYYDAEKPLTLDLDALCDQIGVEEDGERRIVERLLRFKFVKTDDGYTHEICDKVIADYHAKAETAKANGKLGGRPRKAAANPKEPSGFPSGSDPVASSPPLATQSQANQEPITNNHKPEEEQTTCAAAPAAVVEAAPELPPEPAEPPAYTLPTNTGDEFPIVRQRVEEFTELYPGVDVMQELRKMRGWLISNPAKRKTKKGMMAFVNNWLSKQQNTAGSQMQGRRIGPANGRPSINNIGVAPGADDDIFNQMRTEFLP